MEKLTREDGASPDIVADNIERLREIFPEVFADGSIDFDALKQTLGDYVDDREERYSFTWHGKSRARQIAQMPSMGTLRPCPERSVNWDTTKNIFIEGDNLEVLKLLQKSYHRKVKMIYIDPPYNTGKEFIYPDKWQDNLDTYLRYTGQIDDEGFKLSANPETSGRYHTNWLNMMYPRLKLARNLLRDDGLILTSIDDHEVHNLRNLCDEIFGEENLIAQLVWKKSYGGGAKSKYAVSLHEYILCYARQKDSIQKIELPPDPAVLKYYKYRDERFEVRGPYRLQPLATTSMDDRPNLRYAIPFEGEDVWPEKQWQWSESRTMRALANNELVIRERADGWSVDYKQYLRNEEGKERGSKLYSLLDSGPYTQQGTADIKALFGDGKVFSFPKPVELLRHLVSITKPDAIVLDFFAGSGTTGHALMSLNATDGGCRRFILVQLPEPTDNPEYPTLSELCAERLSRAGSAIRGDEGRDDVDIGFKVFKLASSNIKPWDADFDTMDHDLVEAIDNIKSDRSEDDVLYELLLKYGLDLAIPSEARKIEGRTVTVIGSGALIVCLADDITLDVVSGIAALKAELKPEIMRVVFKDSGFADDVAKTNAAQILRQAGIDDVKSL